MSYEIKKQLLDKIKEYNKIFIFRHKRPDGDATGSTKGLKRILELSYPEKEIRLQNCDFADYMAFLGGEDELLPDEAYADAKAMLTRKRDLLDEIALYLLSKETITGEELMAYVNADKQMSAETEETTEE